MVSLNWNGAYRIPAEFDASRGEMRAGVSTVRPHYPGHSAKKPAFHRLDKTGWGKISFMLELLLLVLLVVLLFGAIGPRYYRGRGRRRVVRDYDTF